MACGSWKKSTMCVCVPRSRSGRVVFWTRWKESGCASNSGDGVGRSRGRWNRLTAYWASGPAAVAWNTCSAIPATGSPNRASSGSDLWKTSRTNRCRPSTPPVSSNPGPCCAWPAVSPARPVVTLFDASIERLDYDKDGIHLKFRNEGKEREVTPNSLVNMVSSGTLRGGALVGRALETLRAGGYLIVDELENSINKQLVFAIMDLFASPVTNPHGATLLFSTHYPELLDHFTRKDSIWFAVRDGKGFALRNLGAYLGRTDLKKSVSFFANRVPGTAPSYAAVRALQDYAERYVHA